MSDDVGSDILDDVKAMTLANDHDIAAARYCTNGLIDRRVGSISAAVTALIRAGHRDDEGELRHQTEEPPTVTPASAAACVAA